MDNSSWHAKAINNVMFDKLDHIRRFYFFQRNSFCPFGEVKSVMGRINRCPLKDGGQIGPITFIPYISNGYEKVVR